MSEHTSTAPTQEFKPMFEASHPGELHPQANKEQQEAHAKQLALHNAMKQTINVKEGKDVKTLTPIAAVYRNGVAAPLYATDIERVKEGSDKKGLAYPCVHIQWAKDHAQEFLQWIGIPTVVRWASSKLKGVAQNLLEEACDDLKDVAGNVVYYVVKGKRSDDPKPDYSTFDINNYLELMEDLSPRSETLVEINNAILGLVEEMVNLDLDSFVTKYGPERGIAEYGVALKAIKQQVESYKLAKDKKRRHKTTSLAEGADTDSTTESAKVA